jgi:uncharacterized protein (DUF2267 family)
MLEQIAQQVAEKTGLSKEMAMTAVQVVIDQLKQRLPAPVAGQIDAALAGGGEAGGGLSGMAKGLFGG